MSGYTLSKRAKQDLSGIVRYTAKTWGKAQAKTYSEAIVVTCERLAEGKGHSRPVEEIRQVLRKAKSGSHFIYFEQTDDGIYVIRILHQAMDVERWLG